MKVNKVPAQNEVLSLTVGQGDERARQGALILAALLALLGALAGLHAMLAHTHLDPKALFLGLEAASVLGVSVAVLLYHNSTKEELTVVHKALMEELFEEGIEMHSLNRNQLQHEEQTLLNTHHPKGAPCQ